MPTNGERAERAACALDDYAGEELPDTDSETLLVDLLTDLRHFCRSNGVSFAEALKTSKTHFEEER